MSNLPNSAVSEANPLSVTEPAADSWKSLCIYKDKHKKVINPSSDLNVKLYIENHPAYKGIFAYDTFKHSKIMMRCPPWENPEEFQIREINDNDKYNLKFDLERFELEPTISAVGAAINIIAMRNKVNPPIDWFNSLVWDQIPRLDNWLITYFGAKDDPRYIKAVGAKWLMAGVARVMKPGIKFDSILVLEGVQGAGKSTALEILATVNGIPYFDDTFSISDLGNEKQVPKMQGILIMELQELAKFAGESQVLKKSLTTKRDRIVRKWENEPTTYPRQFIMAATHNPLNGYLQDPTGNRRFWPVECADEVKLEELKKDATQLWAEAVARWTKGESIILEKELWSLATEAQKAREVEDLLTGPVLRIIGDKDRITLDEILDGLNYPMDKRKKDVRNNLGEILHKNGFRNKSKWNPYTKKSESGWEREGSQQELLDQPLKEEEVKW